MENKLFIPEKIKVGYQERDDTYTKRLAYVIYYDNKGVLRKEKSWEGWRSKKIKADEFENKPHSGFVLNKGVQRYGHWGSGRNMVRVYDDRGIEFEITKKKSELEKLETRLNAIISPEMRRKMELDEITTLLNK